MKPTTIIALIAVLHAGWCLNSEAAVFSEDEKITLSGRVTDYEGVPSDSALVEIKNMDFSTAFKTYTDEEGYYSMDVSKGKYLAMIAINPGEYPRFSDLPEEEQRLEYWAWNFIADNDTTINMKYHRLELYGLNVFRIHGSAPGYTIYCRPMGLGRLHEGKKDLCPDPDDLEIVVEINGEPVNVNMKQKVREYVPDGELYGYLLHVNPPAKTGNKPFDIFRVKMRDISNNDIGEASYYLERPGYNN